MAVALNTSSKSLLSYFNSPSEGGGYWKIFDQYLQQFLTVKDLSAFFGTCKAIGRHRYDYSFRAAFVESRCSMEKLRTLVRDLHNGFFTKEKPRLEDQLANYLPSKNKYLIAEEIVFRLAKCLPPVERIFLKQLNTDPYMLSEEQLNKLPEKEQVLYLQESNHFGKQWEDHFKDPTKLPIKEKSPSDEEDELILSLDVNDTPLNPVASKLESKKAPNPESTDLSLYDSFNEELDELSEPDFSALEAGDAPHAYIILPSEPQVNRTSNCCRRALELLYSLADRLCCRKR